MTEKEKVDFINQITKVFNSDEKLTLGHMTYYDEDETTIGLHEYQYNGIRMRDYYTNPELFDKLVEEYEKQLNIYSNPDDAAVIALSRFEEENMEDIIRTILLLVAERPYTEFVVYCDVDDDIISSDGKIQKVVVTVKSVEKDSGEYSCTEDDIYFYHVEVPTEDKPAMEFVEFKDALIEAICKVYLGMADEGIIKDDYQFLISLLPKFMRFVLEDTDVYSRMIDAAMWVSNDMEPGLLDTSTGLESL